MKKLAAKKEYLGAIKIFKIQKSYPNIQSFLFFFDVNCFQCPFCSSSHFFEFGGLENTNLYFFYQILWPKKRDFSGQDCRKWIKISTCKWNDIYLIHNSELLGDPKSNRSNWSTLRGLSKFSNSSSTSLSFCSFCRSSSFFSCFEIFFFSTTTFSSSCNNTLN